MYFTIVEAIPEKASEAFDKYGGAHVACWINSDDWNKAQGKAIALVLNSGWHVKKIVEEKSVSPESYSSSDEAVKYFEQALVDGEVCVFYTFPKDMRD